MLPSTGLFKSFICPYYESGNPNNIITKNAQQSEIVIATCTRPFCHYKHIRKDEPEPPVQEAPPVYKPAPKLLTLPEITMFPRKRPVSLEYQPEKPGMDASPSKYKKSKSAPLYVPATKDTNSDSNDDTFNGSEDTKVDAVEETNTIEVTTEEKILSTKVIDGDDEDVVKVENVKESIKKEKSSSEARDKSRSREHKSHREKDKKKHRDKDDKKISSSSRHKTSSSSKSSKSSRSDKHREGKSKISSTGSSSTTTTTKEHSSKSSSRSRHKSSTSSSPSRDKVKASTSTSEQKSKHTLSDNSITKNSKPSITNNQTKTEIVIDIPEPTEEEIMQECEMIFDKLEKEFEAKHKADNAKAASEEEAANLLKRKATQDIEVYAEAAAASLQRKRVAHENAGKVRSQVPQTTPCRPNHIRNAMEAIFKRRQQLREREEEHAAKNVENIRAAEEKVREAAEVLRIAQEKAGFKPTLTPLIPINALNPPPRTRIIAPVANMMALERAKRKVAELKADKRPAFTPAQVRKGMPRVAHAPTTALEKTIKVEQPKPPVLEPTNGKISFNIRMQYYEMMVKHCLEIYPNLADAWERAQSEELTVFKKVFTPTIYKNSCMLAINKLRKEAIDAGNKPKGTSKIESHEVILGGKQAQKTSWSMENKTKQNSSRNVEPFDALPNDEAFNVVYDLRLTDEQLVANGFPRPGRRLGMAVIQNSRPNRRPNDSSRYCSRCGKVFQLTVYDDKCTDECIYHPKSTGYRRGFADNLHRCCQQPANTPGCTYANYHVSDYYDPDKLTGFVKTIDKSDDYVSNKKDIFALDCEMCYTTHGIELTRITVVDVNGSVVYDALVKPANRIVDYNTTYSGITEQMLANETRTLRDVQAVLMTMFHSKTVLVGHSLESDLKALKLIHDVVVDTSVLFPHKMGPPKKRALKTLCIENLKLIIQENETGHDSAEDAEVCIKLVKFYLRNKLN